MPLLTSAGVRPSLQRRHGQAPPAVPPLGASPRQGAQHGPQRGPRLSTARGGLNEPAGSGDAGTRKQGKFSAPTGVPPWPRCDGTQPASVLDALKQARHMAGDRPAVCPPPHTEKCAAPHMFMGQLTGRPLDEADDAPNCAAHATVLRRAANLRRVPPLIIRKVELDNLPNPLQSQNPGISLLLSPQSSCVS